MAQQSTSQSLTQNDFIKPHNQVFGNLLQTSLNEELNQHFHQEPAIMLTG